MKGNGLSNLTDLINMTNVSACSSSSSQISKYFTMEKSEVKLNNSPLSNRYDNNKHNINRHAILGIPEEELHELEDNDDEDEENTTLNDLVDQLSNFNTEYENNENYPPSNKCPRGSSYIQNININALKIQENKNPQKLNNGSTKIATMSTKSSSTCMSWQMSPKRTLQNNSNKAPLTK
jgi:hypothetical protein